MGNSAELQICRLLATFVKCFQTLCILLLYKSLFFLRIYLLIVLHFKIRHIGCIMCNLLNFLKMHELRSICVSGLDNMKLKVSVLKNTKSFQKRMNPNRPQKSISYFFLSNPNKQTFSLWIQVSRALKNKQTLKV